MGREYYLHQRHGIYYAEFIDKATGKKLSARSTGETDRRKAEIKCGVWAATGIPTGKGKKPRPIAEAAGIETIIGIIRKSGLNSDDALKIVETLKKLELIDIAAVKNTGAGAVNFVLFLENFWDYDKSEYIRDKLSHGYRFSRGYAHGCQVRIKAELKDFFGDKKLNCVTTADLNKLSNQLADRGLSTSTINQILLICCTPLKWCYKQKIIPANPSEGLTKFAITNKERGILTEAEAAAVFTIDWEDKRAFVGSLLAATTGAREGECLALRRSDIGEDTINIAHNYSTIDGLKCPKNGHKRIVPLLPEVKAALMDLLKDNPHNDIDDPFLFYSLSPDKPCDCRVLLDGFKAAMDAVNIKYVEAAEKAKLEKPEITIDYKGRNIIFHSWRHWFCSKITEKIEGEKVAKVSGHLSTEVFKKYADHIEIKNIKEVGNAAGLAFGNILKFRKGA
jgi:integrase